MRSHITLVLTVSLALGLATGCAARNQKQTLKEVESDAPVNCATAREDIRTLEAEKASVGEQVAQGVTAIVPVGAALGILTGTESTKFEVATGDYNAAIDRRIAQIKSECNVR